MLNPTDRQAVAEAVGAAERRSTGEIVTIVTARSDRYTDMALGWSAFIALLALTALNLAPDFYLGLVDRLLGLWAHHWGPRAVLGLALTVASLKFGGMLLLMEWSPLRLALTPGPIKAARVRARARLAFRLCAQGRTRARTGVVIFLSLAERRAELIADSAIADKVGPEVWGEAMHALLREVREGRIGDGLVAAVGQVGDVLAAHFPRSDDKALGGNELPDGPIEL